MVTALCVWKESLTVLVHGKRFLEQSGTEVGEGIVTFPLWSCTRDVFSSVEDSADAGAWILCDGVIVVARAR